MNRVEFTASGGTWDYEGKLPEWDEKISSPNSVSTFATVDDCTFINFITKDYSCSVQQYLFVSNKNETDFTPMHIVNDPILDNVDFTALAYLYSPLDNDLFVHVNACFNFACSGQNNVIIHFNPPLEINGKNCGSIITNTDYVSEFYHNCIFEERMNAWYCENDHLGMLTFYEDSPPGYGTSESAEIEGSPPPVYITQEAEGNYLNTLNAFSNHFFSINFPHKF